MANPSADLPELPGLEVPADLLAPTRARPERRRATGVPSGISSM